MSISVVAKQPFVARSATARKPRASMVACAAPDTRRSIVLGGAALFAGLVADRAAYASLSAAELEVCELGAEGKECREATLARGAEEVAAAKAAYGANKTTFRSASGISVPDGMDEAYVAQVYAIADKIEAYIAADPFDKQRIVLKKEIGEDGNTWTAKYAKGGSTRSPSARKFYVVIDAMKGWFASNGVAPLPKSKAANILKDIQTTKDLIAQSK